MTIFCTSRGITKGHMTLVDSDRQAQLAGLLAHKQPLHSPGGSAANSMIAIGVWGQGLLFLQGGR